MSEVIEFSKIEQLDQVKQSVKTDNIILKSKNGKDVNFKLASLEVDQYFEYVGLVNNFDASSGEIKAPLKDQFNASVKMFAMAIVDEKMNRICDNNESFDIIKNSFGFEEIIKAVEMVTDLSDFSDKAIKETEKN